MSRKDVEVRLLTDYHDTESGEVIPANVVALVDGDVAKALVGARQGDVNAAAIAAGKESAEHKAYEAKAAAAKKKSRRDASE